MPSKGYSWRLERDWDVHNAKEWLQSGLPSHLSSETLKVRKASKKKYAQTMELKRRNFISVMLARLPTSVAQRLEPLLSSLYSPRYFVGVQNKSFAYEGMDPDHQDSEDTLIRKVMLSSFSLTSERVGYRTAGEKLNIVFATPHAT